MIAKTLAYYLDMPQAEMLRLLRTPPHDLIHHPTYTAMLYDLDFECLRKTLPFARTVLEAGLPVLVARWSAEYNLYDFPLNGHMLSDWIGDFLQFPAEVWRLRDVHRGVALPLIHEIIPEILEMMETLGDASRVWQRAFATMVIPLAAFPLPQAVSAT